MNEKYYYLEHTADAKFQACGSNMEEAFKNAALAMFNIMCDIDRIKNEKEMEVKVEGDDLKALLYNWLEELLFILDSKNIIIGEVKNLKISKMENYRLEAVVNGDDAGKYEIFNEVKAVTYNEMFIKEEVIGEKKRIIIQVVVDL